MSPDQANSSVQPGSFIPSADAGPLLLFAGSCVKCRFLSRCVELASLGVIRRESLERPEWRKFYYEDFPQARGYPVLFVRGVPIFGFRVFFAVPGVIVSSLWNLAWKGLRRKHPHDRH